MRIDVAANPEFILHMDSQTLRELSELAKGHYDGVCKSAAHPGGFIYGWMNQLEYSQGEVNGYRCSYYDMNTVAKICEMAGYARNGRLIGLYHNAMRALHYANQNVATIRHENVLGAGTLNVKA